MPDFTGIGVARGLQRQDVLASQKASRLAKQQELEAVSVGKRRDNLVQGIADMTEQATIALSQGEIDEQTLTDSFAKPLLDMLKTARQFNEVHPESPIAVAPLEAAVRNALATPVANKPLPAIQEIKEGDQIVTRQAGPEGPEVISIADRFNPRPATEINLLPSEELVSKPSELIQYRDAEGNPPRGPMTAGELSKNFTLRSENELKRIDVVSNVRPTLEVLVETANDVFTDETFMQRAQTAANKGLLNDFFQRDPLALKYTAARNSILSLLSRFTGEVGVLTDQDIERMKALMPNAEQFLGFRDLREVAALKFDILGKIFSIEGAGDVGFGIDKFFSENPEAFATAEEATEAATAATAQSISDMTPAQRKARAAELRQSMGAR